MFFVVDIFNKQVNHFIRQWLLLRMDATSRKLIRRARLRRSHERHARTTAKGFNKKRQAHEEPQPEAYQHMCDSDQLLTSIDASHSTVPSLPSLSDSQSLTAKHKNHKHQRRSRVSKGCLSDSYEPACKEYSDGKLSRGGNTSDTAVVCSRQPPALVPAKNSYGSIVVMICDYRLNSKKFVHDDCTCFVRFTQASYKRRGFNKSRL